MKKLNDFLLSDGFMLTAFIAGALYFVGGMLYMLSN
jgi:hypothetical protein